jgi:hypothetical protein
MPTDGVDALQHVCDCLDVNLASVAKICLAGRTEHWNELADNSTGGGESSRVIVVTRLRRPLALKNRENAGMAGRLPGGARQALNGLAKVAAGDMPLERNDVALRAAAAAKENLLSGVDGETVGAAADGTWSDPLSAAMAAIIASRSAISSCSSR